jgi:hypothetical protein
VKRKLESGRLVLLIGFDLQPKNGSKILNCRTSGTTGSGKLSY